MRSVLSRCRLSVNERRTFATGCQTPDACVRQFRFLTAWRSVTLFRHACAGHRPDRLAVDRRSDSGGAVAGPLAQRRGMDGARRGAYRAVPTPERTASSAKRRCGSNRSATTCWQTAITSANWCTSYEYRGMGRPLRVPRPGRRRSASVLRQLLTVDGRPPRPGDEPGCMDPKPVSPEPLGLLLPHRQGENEFTWRGQGRERGRASVTLNYKPTRVLPAAVVWTENCVSVDLPGRTRGRVWIDQATGDVLRLDEELTSQYQFPVPKSSRTPARPGQHVHRRARRFVDRLPSGLVSRSRRERDAARVDHVAAGDSQFRRAAPSHHAEIFQVSTVHHRRKDCRRLRPTVTQTVSMPCP